MIVLGLDTSTKIGSVCVVRDHELLADARAESQTHGSEFLPMIDDVCKRAGVAPKDLEAVAIGAGPGSFTGLRIGMATAKGIAFAGKRPLWAVSSLAALAYEVGVLGNEMAPIACVLDARRSEVFVGLYRRDGERVVSIVDEAVMAPRDVRAHVELHAPGARYAGDARGVYAELAEQEWTGVITPSAFAVARLSRESDPVDVLTSGVPAYLRKAEAEIMYPDGVPGALRR